MNFLRITLPKEKKIRFFSLGRIHYKKQPDVLIRAFNSIVKDGQNLKLVIAGIGDSAYIETLKILAV